MPTRFRVLKCCALAVATCTLIPSGSAKMEQWTDTQGNKFKAEPAEVVGPFALFRLPDKSGKLLPLSLLGAPDCIRFAEQVRAVPQPAADWAQTRTGVGAEICGGALRLEGEKLVAADLKGRPEPRFYVLFFVANAESKSWDMLGKTGWPFQELQRNHPGLVEGFMFSVKTSSLDHAKMATHMKVPFLVSEHDDQQRMATIGRLTPSTNYGVVICNANGVPLFPIARADTDESAKAVFTQFDGFLGLLRLDDVRGLRDREYFWKTVQPALHAADKCGPMLVGDPLNAAKLRALGVGHFEATVFVSAEGVVTGVSMAPGSSCPEELAVQITDALNKAARFVPAVDGGKFVAGSYHYRFGD